MSQRVLKRKIVQKYFDFIYDQAKCKLCSAKLKSNRIYNLKVHLIKLHKISEDELKTNFKKEFGVEFAEKKFKRQTVKIEICRKELIRSCIGLVIEDNMPFDILDSENFTNIVDPICQGLFVKYGKKSVVNSSSCKEVLKSVANNIRYDITSDLYQRLLSLKIHSANGLSRNVFGVSVQFIKNGEIHSHTLGLVEMVCTGSSKTRSLATDILNTLTNYDVNLNQIVSITSDNGANMIKSSKILSHCSIFEDGYKGQDLDDGNKVYLNNAQLFEETSKLNFGDFQVTRCLAYVTQLCVLDVTKNAEVTDFIFSCRNFVKFVQKPSNGFREIFELQNLIAPQLDCPTKSGSTYSMIESLKHAKGIFVKIEPVENKTIDENFVLDDSFWNFIEAYCIVFEPLQIAITKYQEEQLHYGNFYAEWLKCKLCTEKLFENCSNVYVKKIAKILLNCMENRTKELLDNESLLACLYLDPRFNHTLTLTKKLQAIVYLKNIYERIKTVNMHIEQIKTEEISIAPCSSQTETVEFSQKADEYLNEYLTRNFAPNGSEGSADIAVKLEKLQMPFQRVDANVLQFWMEKKNSDPELFVLSSICFAIPSNQVTAEHSFSSLKNIFEDTHNDRDTLENILQLKQNPTYLDEAIENLPLFEVDD